MRYKKIYIEITNCCNFNCSFCFKTARGNRFMSVAEFQIIVDKIRPFTNYIYLHVLGEPLLHPQLEEILIIAKNAELNVNITTNGALLESKKEILLKQAVRQVNISVHDAEENLAPDKWADYIKSVIDFATAAAEKTYVCLRLWNTTNVESEKFNLYILKELALKFSLSADLLENNKKGNGFKLTNHIFLQRAPRFEWPTETRVGVQTQKNCYALRDHIAILADGQVVPCCLDADANLKLGNIFTENLSDIIETQRAKNIKKGFEQHKIVEQFCTSCGFSTLL